MQDIKADDPEFWCQMYRRNQDPTSRKQTKPRVRSKSYSPARSLGRYGHDLNLTGERDSPYGSARLVPALSPLANNSKDKQKDRIGGDQHESLEDIKSSTACRQIRDTVVTDTGKTGKAVPVKRKKTRGKSKAHDRATTQFIRKSKADCLPCSEQNSAGHFSSQSNCDEDRANREVDSNLKRGNPSKLDTDKQTSATAGKIQPKAGGMQDGQPSLASSSAMHGLCPGITHNAYVLHWLQEHSGRPQNQRADRNCPQLYDSPCAVSSETPCNSCFPLHSSPVHQSHYGCGECPCVPGKQDVPQTPSCLLQPPIDIHSVQAPHQIPISPGAKSFLAMLQHKPEVSTVPLNDCPTHLSFSEQTCHPSSQTVHCGQTCNSPQCSACSPFVSPTRRTLYSRCLHPNINMLSLEHAAMLLQQSQLHESPICPSLRASYGSPARQTTMQHNPAGTPQRTLDDSLPMSSFYDSVDRSRCEDKSASENPAPIGVFWDIENCAVPRGKSALAVVQSVRDRFFGNHREAEFMCVCDINKENATVIQELNDAQVTVAHINATAKNAADDKLKQSLRRFADTHSPPATVVLISGDVNFARDLSDLRHRNNLQVILVHRDEASDALKACANEVVRYQDLVHDLPYRSPTKQSGIESCTLIIHNLPCRKDASQLRNRLKQLSENCGGKVIHVSYKNAVIQFPNVEKASRAKIRLDGENVFGNQISVAYPKNKSTCSNSAERHSNKGSPHLIQDNVQDNIQDMMASHSDSKDEEDDDQCDTEEEMSEEPEREEGISSRSDSEHKAGADSKDSFRIGYPASSYKLRHGSADHRVQDDVEDPQAVSLSANRIAAAFRPIQSDVKCSAEVCNSPAGTADSKPVVEIWPRTDHINARARTAPSKTDLKPASVSTLSLVNFPPSISLHDHSKHPSSAGQPDCSAQSVPGLLPFKPAPTVQRIATPPQFQQAHALCTREQRSISPVLRGTYRPPSPMLANPMGDWQYMSVQDPDNGTRKGAELLVTNLDNKMSRQDLKKSLLARLNEYCKVLHLIFGSPVPGRYQAVVRVPSIPDAIRAMANINRCQLGTRLLHVSLLMPSDSNADKLRLMIIPMLQEIPGMCQPLGDLKTSFERRYRQILFIGDLYHIPDTVTIRETSVGKIVALTTQSRPSTPNSDVLSPAGIQSAASFVKIKEPLPEPCEPFCSIHDCQDALQYRHVTQDPFVIVSTRTFSSQVHTLLLMHNGKIPLISFMVCYAAEFPTLTEDFESGVPLEHLLTCIQGVQVGVSQDGFKTVCWERSKPQMETGSRSSTPLLPPQLFQFSKEAVELLKHTPRCGLPFSKFIPSYHHHFGRQCRVADYGFLKLIELFDAISHVIQVLGMTENKLLTLTHRTQIKRFSQDLLKVLKSQASRQVTVEEFPSAYLRCFNKPWNVTVYGVCDLQDLLTEVPETMAMINWNGDDTLIFIPKREQSREELIRMRKFGREVVDLLSHQPRYRILFSKFIPTYHHHFGRQCRVGDYGFNKLLELFEAMEDVIQVEEQGDERVVILTTDEQLAVIARHTSEMLQRNRLHLINLDTFNEMYTRCFVFPVFLKDYSAKNMQELMGRFPHVVEVVSDGFKQHLHLVENVHLSQLTQQMLVVLLETDDGRLAVEDVSVAFHSVWGRELVPLKYGHSRLVTLMNMLHYVLMVQNEWMDGCYVELTPSHQFARQARNVLVAENRLSMTFQELAAKYHKLHGVQLQPGNFGHAALTSLIEKVPRVLSVVNKGAKRAVTLNPSCLVPGSQTDTGKTHTLRRLRDQRMSFSKVEASGPPYECSDGKLSTYADAAVSLGTQATSGPSNSSKEESLTLQENSESVTATNPNSPDIPRALRHMVNKSRGRCQLAAKFSMKEYK